MMYRLIVSLDPIGDRNEPRGADNIQHTFWMTAATDDDAQQAAFSVIDVLLASDLKDRFTVVRGTTTNFVAVEKWTGLNSSRQIGKVYFAIPEPQELSVPIPEVPGGTFTYNACWPWTHRRGAVLVECSGGPTKRRVYVGPVSLYVARVTLAFVGFDTFDVLAGGLGFDDLPIDTSTHSIDLWPESFAELAAQYVWGVRTAIGLHGEMVCRTATGATYQVESVRAGLARADLRDRGLRSSWTDTIAPD